MADEEKEYEKKVMIGDIAQFFHLEQVTGDEMSLNRWVVIPDLNRPGFELSGYYEPTEPRRIVILGQKEWDYINQLSPEQQRERYPAITDGLTPMIIVTHNNPVPEVLVEVATERNFPVFRTPLVTYQLMVDLITYLDEHLAPEQTISGELMVVYGKGVLITGESGMGKSETALELIRDGQVLVSDDRVDVQKFHNSLVGHAPEMLKGMMEIRGIGIVDIERMYGANCISNRANIDLIVHLTTFDPHHEYTRIGDEENKFTTILDIDVPTLELPVSPGRITSSLVESAVMNYLLQKEGYKSSEVFKKRLASILKRNTEQEEETL